MTGALRAIFLLTTLAATPAAALAQSDLAQQGPAVNSSPAPAAPGSAPILRRLANNAERFRLSGEIATIEWPVYLTDAEAAAKVRFRLGYFTAVSVMPEDSTLKLTINDRAVGATPILATPQERTVEFEVPGSLLKPGFNAVRISADQRHRVDCSLAATYELWTQVDPASTGLLFPADDPGPAGVADLPAVAPDERGGTPIRAVLPAHATGEDVERVFRAVQQIALAGRFAQPLIDFGPLTDGPGLNLVIGTGAQLAETLGEPATASEPHVSLRSARRDRRATLVVAGSDRAQLDVAVSEIAPSGAPKGSPEGLRALLSSAGYPIEGGQRLKLQDVGIASQEFGGRRFRAVFSVDLPTDFYPADYGKAILDLAGGYAPGLTGAEIEVSVNGRETTTLRLPKASGEVYEHNELPLPLGSLRPGVNRIEIAADLPTQEDGACALRASSVEPPRFLLLDSSTLTLPRIARVARSPDLAATAMGAFPLAGAKKRPSVIVPAPDRPSLGAAATLVAQLAVASGRATDYRIALDLPRPGDGAALVVGAAANLDPKLLDSLGLPKDLLTAAWGEAGLAAPVDSESGTLERARAPLSATALRRDRPLSCGDSPVVKSFVRPAQSGNLAPSSAPAAAKRGAEPSLAAQWNERLNGSIFDKIRHGFDDTTDWVASRYAAAVELYRRRFGASKASAVLTEQSSLAIAQANFDASPDGVVTLVTAPDASALQSGAACLVDPSVWRKLSGRLATLNAMDGSMASMPAERTAFIVTAPLSITNVRLIAAGWLSLNTDAYVAFALAIIFALACSTMGFVRNVGRRME